ncbi:hypothetical protein ACFE04_000487 [Oxalis oulophora]
MAEALSARIAMQWIKVHLHSAGSIYLDAQTIVQRVLNSDNDLTEFGVEGLNLAVVDSSTTEINDLTDLMGLEKCEENDKECFKRRIIADAHLDYIYTQNHNP